MSHYRENYENESASNNVQQNTKGETKTNLFYSNKLGGIRMVTEMIQLELDSSESNEVKIKHMLSQIVCLAETKI